MQVFLFVYQQMDDTNMFMILAVWSYSLYICYFYTITHLTLTYHNQSC